MTDTADTLSARRRKQITFALASSKISYCSETGELRWKDARSKRMNGQLAGHRGKRYIEVRIGEALIHGHRLAWLLHYGSLPPKGMVLDHINRNGYDNRISNLRCVSYVVNVINRAGKPHRGVCFCKQTGRWKSTASVNRKQIWLGRFESRDAALAARIKAELAMYPAVEVPRDGM